MSIGFYMADMICIALNAKTFHNERPPASPWWLQVMRLQGKSITLIIAKEASCQHSTRKEAGEWGHRQKMWYSKRNSISYYKNTWEFLSCKSKNSLASQWYHKFLPEPYVYTYWKPLYICYLFLHWALLNCLWPLWDLFHTFKIKITYTPHILPLSGILNINYQAHCCGFV